MPNRPTHHIRHVSLMQKIQITIVYQVIYGTTIAATKLSYLAFFRRIFGIMPDFMKWGYALTALVVLWWTANILQIFFICRPFALNWNKTIPGVCGDAPLSFVMIAVFNIVTDVGILLLPIPYVSSLQMQRKKKYTLITMFGLGLL